MPNPLRVANGAGFLGDDLDAPRRLVESAEVDYLTLEYLAELTLSILAHLRDKNPAAGYAQDFMRVLQSLRRALKEQPQLRLITNGGGMNPLACAREAARLRVAAGAPDEIIAAVTGDDLLASLPDLQAAGCAFENLDTGQSLAELKAAVASVNVYLGAEPIVEALAGGARLVVTGRVADASLTVAPAVHHFRWAWDDWNRLAAASVAGHLIECGAQVTGGYSSRWQGRHLVDVGYPIAEIESTGDSVITKPVQSGGAVNRCTVVEQLVYEIGDPRHYLTPDVDVDFTTVEVAECGSNRVAVHGATGNPRPDCLKVSLAYRAGYSASGQLLVYGRDCLPKARECADIILERVRRAGQHLERTHLEYLGLGAGVPGHGRQNAEPHEILLRIAVQAPKREAVERFTAEFAPLITSGPAGLAGYASGRSPVRPVLAYWPTLVPRSLVKSVVTVRSASEWCADSSGEAHQ